MIPLPADLPALAAGGKATLARCLSTLETAPEDPALVALLEAAWRTPKGLALGLTGPPGVGKSTLTKAFLVELRQRGATVGVIAIDPSSRLSGGALLGDRTQIATDPDDAGAFVRSMAARRHLGGLAEPAFPAVVLMRACFDWVIVETVGVGQSETEVADVADLVLLCVQPGAGDALQFMKAGIMEVPDLVLVTKGDLGPAAERAAADLKGALSLAANAGDGPPVALVSALTGDGIPAALDLVGVRRPGPAGLAIRRKAQSDAWILSRLINSFGSVGAAAIESHLIDKTMPFASHAGLSKRFRTALHESLKDL